MSREFLSFERGCNDGGAVAQTIGDCLRYTSTFSLGFRPVMDRERHARDAGIP